MSRGKSSARLIEQGTPRGEDVSPFRPRSEAGAADLEDVLSQSRSVSPARHAYVEASPCCGQDYSPSQAARSCRSSRRCMTEGSRIPEPNKGTDLWSLSCASRGRHSSSNGDQSQALASALMKHGQDVSSVVYEHTKTFASAAWPVAVNAASATASQAKDLAVQSWPVVSEAALGTGRQACQLSAVAVQQVASALATSVSEMVHCMTKNPSTSTIGSDEEDRDSGARMELPESAKSALRPWQLPAGPLEAGMFPTFQPNTVLVSMPPGRSMHPTFSGQEGMQPSSSFNMGMQPCGSFNMGMQATGSNGSSMGRAMSMRSTNSHDGPRSSFGAPPVQANYFPQVPAANMMHRPMYPGAMHPPPTSHSLASASTWAGPPTNQSLHMGLVPSPQSFASQTGSMHHGGSMMGPVASGSPDVYFGPSASFRSTSSMNRDHWSRPMPMGPMRS